jgi:hypothetical protein
MNAIKVKYFLKFRDYLKIFLFHSPRTIALWLIFIIGLCFLFFGIFNFLSSSSSFDFTRKYLLLGGLLAIVIPAVILLRVKDSYTSNYRLEEKITYIFNEGSIQLFGKSFKSEFGWDRVQKIEKVGSYIRFQYCDNYLNFIAIKAFGKKYPDFLDMVARNTEFDFKEKPDGWYHD